MINWLVESCKSTSTFDLERNRICACKILKMETLSHRARVAGRMPLEKYSGCSEVQGGCCTAVLSTLQLSRLGLCRDGLMSGTEDVEVTLADSSCIRLAIALNIIRIDRLCAG